MRYLPRLLVALTLLILIPLHVVRSHAASPAAPFHMLSAEELRQAHHAASIAKSDPHRASQWLRTRADVLNVSLGSDGQIKQVVFRNHAAYYVFPAIPGVERISGIARSKGSYERFGAAGPAAKRAVVLEPFAGSDGVAANAGNVEIQALTQSGFQVDVYRNGAVTIPLMQKLSDYSVVYFESHSMSDGTDGFVLTGDTNQGGYQQFCCYGHGDGSVIVGYPQNDPNVLYLGFTSKFISDHMGSFPPSSIVFLNGCSMLRAPRLMDAFMAKGVDSVLSWDGEAQSGDAEQAADFMFPKFAAGETIAAALTDAQAALLDTSFVNTPSGSGVARLGYEGDGEASFAKALVGATPTPTATPVPPTATPTPEPTSTPTATATPTGPFPLDVAITGGLKLNRDATLRVTVTAADTSDPVPGASVVLDGRKVGLSQVLKKTTGPKGQVVFKHLRPAKTGTLVVKISKTGFLAVKRSFKVKR